MGSIFDQMKKLKNILVTKKSHTVLDPAKRQAARKLSSENLTKCPACNREFSIHTLKQHLVAKHGVNERTSLSDAVAMLSGGKISAQQLYNEKPEENSQPSVNKQISHARQSNVKNLKTNKQRQKKKPLDGLDKNKNLAGYSERVVKLPNGEDHVVFIKCTFKPNKSTAVPRKTMGTHKPIATLPVNKPPSTERADRNLSPNHDKPILLTKRSFSLSNSDEFNVAENWVALGSKTTLCISGRPFIARMGIDFGTAFTKASIGYGDDIFIVDWAGIKNGSEKFTLPCEFSVLPDGSCVVGRAPGATRVATDLKLPFLEGNASHAALIDATIFLSLIMRYIRGWWFHHHKGLINTHPIEWNINLGAPTTPWQNKRIRETYEKAARSAWVLSCIDQDITIEHAKSIFKTGSPNVPPVDIVPEFVAQIASYTRSPQRQPDLHLLVDVGAGTVDVVTFNVHRDDNTGEDHFPIFWANVINLGTHYLMSRRLDAFPLIRNEQWHDATTVPTSSEFSETLGISIDDVIRIDTSHSSAVAAAISSVLKTTKQKRYRRSPNWQVGVRVFFCGGGSSCNTFEESISIASKLSGVPLHRIRLPLPSYLKAPSLPPEYFHRVSVAVKSRLVINAFFEQFRFFLLPFLQRLNG